MNTPFKDGKLIERASDKAHWDEMFDELGSNQYAFDNAMMLQDSCMPDAPYVTAALLRESEEVSGKNW